jgi:hypothetical protein
MNERCQLNLTVHARIPQGQGWEITARYDADE